MNASSPMPKQRADGEPAFDAARDHLVDVLLDEVLLVRFVGVGGEDRRFVDQADRAGERVLEDGRGVGEDVDARAAEFRQRDQFGALGAAEVILGDPRAEQVERLRDADAVALEHLAAPEHDADGFRAGGRAWRDRRFEQLLDGAFALALGRFARQHAHVGRGHVAAGGQDVPVADDLAARRRFEVAAVERRAAARRAPRRRCGRDRVQSSRARSTNVSSCVDVVRALSGAVARRSGARAGSRARRCAWPRRGAQHFALDQRARGVADLVEHVVVVGAAARPAASGLRASSS